VNRGKEIELFSEGVALYSYMYMLDFRTKVILLVLFLNNNFKAGNVILIPDHDHGPQAWY
jgi:hypothetical protein